MKKLIILLLLATLTLSAKETLRVTDTDDIKTRIYSLQVEDSEFYSSPYLDSIIKSFPKIKEKEYPKVYVVHVKSMNNYNIKKYGYYNAFFQKDTNRITFFMGDSSYLSFLAGMNDKLIIDTLAHEFGHFTLAIQYSQVLSYAGYTFYGVPYYDKQGFQEVYMSNEYIADAIASMLTSGKYESPDDQIYCEYEARYPCHNHRKKAYDVFDNIAFNPDPIFILNKLTENNLLTKNGNQLTIISKLILNNVRD